MTAVHGAAAVICLAARALGPGPHQSDSITIVHFAQPVAVVRQSGFLDSFPFDPAGLDSPTNQTKELKNGRLAVRARLPLRARMPKSLLHAVSVVDLSGPNCAWPGGVPFVPHDWQKFAAASQVQELIYKSAVSTNVSARCGPREYMTACLLAQMIAFVGFAVQALVTREGPIEGLFNHISNPLGHNILTNVLDIPTVLAR